MRVALIFAACAGLGVAQRTPASPPRADARIEGTVLASAGKAPLRRARVTINPLDAGRTPISAETDEKGRFEIREIVPGRYTVTATRDGYLDTSIALRNGDRMPADRKSTRLNSSH